MNAPSGSSSESSTPVEMNSTNPPTLSPNVPLATETSSAPTPSTTNNVTFATPPPPEDNTTTNITNNVTDNRHLQDQQKSGKFFIISHPQNGKVLYEFDSRTELSIQNHNFAPLGIAHRPAYGNYDSGLDNTNDVLMWGSGRGSSGGQGGATSGETLLYQLPQGFDISAAAISATVTQSFGQPRVMESVAWVTSTQPTFSTNGLDVYFTISGNRLIGWNDGRKFDVVANFGPISLPFGIEQDFGAGRPIVMAMDDTLLLLGSTDNDALFAIDSKSGVIVWNLTGLGTDSLLTTPQLSPDGDVAYFGKKNSVYAVNITDGSLLWGETGFQHPSNVASDPPMLADFSLSLTGEHLYYSRSGPSISAIEVATLIPTEAPVAPTSIPSSMPTLSSSMMPSSSPSLSLSMSPSSSSMPSMSTLPSQSSSPSLDPNFIFPSSSPSMSSLPSSSPTILQSDGPSFMPSNVTSMSPPTQASLTTSEPTTSEFIAEPVTSVPSPSSNDSPSSSSSSAAELNGNSEDGSSSPLLSTTAVIGIAVGGGIGLILMLGAICYVYKKKSGEDDGVDREWARSNNNNSQQNAGGGTEGLAFQYEVEEGQPHQPRYGEGELRW